jgi:glycosyltransferase involved in cell wall biosynthesis
MISQKAKPRIAWWHRFGPAEQTELFHAMPLVVEKLAKDYEVHFYGFKGHKPVPEKIKKYAIIHELPFYTDRSSPLDIKVKFLIWMMFFPFLALSCRFKRMKAVHIDESVPLFGILMLMFFGGPTSITVADIYPDIYLQKNVFTRFIGKVLLAIDFFSWRRLSLIITRARSTKQYLVSNRFVAEKIVPIYDPCDFELYHPLDRSECKKVFGYDDSHFVMVCHGILHPNKGVDRLIRATAEVRRLYPHLRLLIVGDGNERPKLMSLTRELGAESVIQFTGWLPSSREINRAINAGDIGVIMRVGFESDHFHITGGLVHNLCCRIPVLSVRLRGIQEIVHDGETGFLFDANNMEEFKEKLGLLIRDPPLRDRIGKSGYDLARNIFSTERIATLTAESLASVVSGKSLAAAPDRDFGLTNASDSR